MIIKVDPQRLEKVKQDKRAYMRLSFAQMLSGLVAEGWITFEEGRAWLAGTPPAQVSALIDQLPQDQRFLALARAVAPTEIVRTDPLVVALGQSSGKTDDEMDQFFTKHMVH